VGARQVGDLELALLQQDRHGKRGELLGQRGDPVCTIPSRCSVNRCSAAAAVLDGDDCGSTGADEHPANIPTTTIATIPLLGLGIARDGRFARGRNQHPALLDDVAPATVS
jgi:hypothetical protein